MSAVSRSWSCRLLHLLTVRPAQIISVFQLNLEDQKLSLALAERMSLHRLRDYMGTGLEPVLGYLRYGQLLREAVLLPTDQVISLGWFTESYKRRTRTCPSSCRCASRHRHPGTEVPC